MEHDAPLVVGLVAGPAGDALDLFDDAVAALCPGVGDAELEERLDLGPPLLDRAGQAGRLGMFAVAQAVRNRVRRCAVVCRL